ncbi:MAG: MlaD family protein [Pseudomonadota bacterium]
METKANYVLIGAFTLAGIFGALALLLWLAKVEVDRQYAYYDILFPDVAGLATASDVRYNGLPVGQVVDLDLDKTDPSKVRVRIEVSSDTPVNSKTVAKLQSQGVTGVSYVALSGGSADAKPLAEGQMIKSEPSALQSVFEGAPLLLEKAIALLENINTVVDDQNRAAVATILDNLASSSGRLDSALGDFESLSADLGSAAREVAEFTDRLDALADTADTTLTTATNTLETANTAITSIDDFTTGQLTPLAKDMRETAQTATRVVDSLGTRAQGLADSLESFADDGTVAIATAKQTFENADETLALIDAAMLSATETLNIAETTFDNANNVIENDLGGIIDDLRNATNAVTTTVTGASGNIDKISDDILAASQSAASFVGKLESLVTNNERQVSEFLRLGLPELTRFTEEARSLVVNLERLVNKVERDPARFLLGTQNSEFRR